MCRFPAAAEAQEKGRNVAVIRLITRIIFIWFMKEQKLVSDDLFDQGKVKEMLQHTEGESSTYYRAILQNLFFATLSTQPQERKFGSEVRGPKGYNPDYGNQYVFRYQECFRHPEKIKDYFGDIPFLNGGLFECLDKKKKEGQKEVIIDGFSRIKKHQPWVPNFLFFSPTAGLFTILSTYNFTIDENTPIEEDIALDPELLGRVFENLLASYNPETNTTARKQTGSFYTPREIVDYMVDESLLAYLKNSLRGQVKEAKDKSALEKNLRDLLGYNERQPFEEEEVEAIIAAIDRCRAIGPGLRLRGFSPGGVAKDGAHY